MADGRIGAARESDVVSLAMHPDHEHAKVRFADGSIDDVVSLHVVGSLDDVLPALVKLCHPERCRVCGCTDEDCRQCIEKTGEPCSWVEADLCSACAPDAFLEATTPAAWKCSKCGGTDAALPCVEIAPGIEPETSYTRALRTKTCPHCSADIGSNIWDCPACERSLSDVPDGRKPGDEWTTEGGRLLRYVPWTDQLGPTLAVLDVAADKVIATRDASCQPFDWPGAGKPTIGGNLAVNAGFPDGGLSIKRVQSYFSDAGRWEIVRRYRSGWTKDQELLPEEMRIEDFGATFERLEDALAAVRSHTLEERLVNWSDWLDAQADHHGIPRDDPRLERDCAP